MGSCAYLACFISSLWLSKVVLSQTITIPNYVNKDNSRPKEVTQMTILGIASDGGTTIAFVEQDSLTTVTETAVVKKVAAFPGRSSWVHFIETAGPLARICTMGIQYFVCVATSTRLYLETRNHELITHTSVSRYVEYEPETAVVIAPTDAVKSPIPNYELVPQNTLFLGLIAGVFTILGIVLAIILGVFFLRQRRIARIALRGATHFLDTSLPEYSDTEDGTITPYFEQTSSTRSTKKVRDSRASSSSSQTPSAAFGHVELSTFTTPFSTKSDLAAGNTEMEQPEQESDIVEYSSSLGMRTAQPRRSEFAEAILRRIAAILRDVDGDSGRLGPIRMEDISPSTSVYNRQGTPPPIYRDEV